VIWLKWQQPQGPEFKPQYCISPTEWAVGEKAQIGRDVRRPAFATDGVREKMTSGTGVEAKFKESEWILVMLGT
jgi:hypothetical protein